MEWDRFINDASKFCEKASISDALVGGIGQSHIFYMGGVLSHSLAFEKTSLLPHLLVGIHSQR
jgi:hypothetical protein